MENTYFEISGNQITKVIQFSKEQNQCVIERLKGNVCEAVHSLTIREMRYGRDEYLERLLKMRKDTKEFDIMLEKIKEITKCLDCKRVIGEMDSIEKGEDIDNQK